METRHGVSTKVLSLFLSVLMALSCFTVALPGLVPDSKAAATQTDWEKLVDAFTAAYNGGYFSTDTYTVSNDNAGHYTVVDDTGNDAFIYSIVRALINVAIAEKSAGTDHNGTLRESIKTTLATKMAVTEPMNEFIDSLLPVPASEDDGAYYYYGTHCWEGAENSALKPQEPLTFTLTVSRSVKAAVVNDYENAADVPATVETQYTLTTTANAYEGSSALGEGRCTVWYQNDQMVASSGQENAPDLTAIENYVSLVSDEAWLADYNAYVADSTSVYDKTYAELVALNNAFYPLDTALGGFDNDYIEKFIGIENFTNYRAYVNYAYGGRDVVNYRNYVEWITGEPLSSVPGFEGSINSRDYNENDRERMLALIAQATGYKNILDNASTAAQQVFVDSYGYNLSDYPDYINELTYKVDFFDAKDILKAYNYISTHNDASNYTFPAGSAFYTAAEYVLTSDTAVVEGKTYYTLSVVDDEETYTAVEAPDAAAMGAYYEYIPSNSIVSVGTNSFSSQEYNEAGHIGECPVGDEALAATYFWLSSVLNNTVAGLGAQAKADAGLTFEVIAAMGDLADAMANELQYRNFGDAAFKEHYEYFINLLINVNPKAISDINLHGRPDDPATVDDPSTPEVENNEYVKGLIATATEHYNALNSIVGSNPRFTAFKSRCLAYINNLYAVLFNRNNEKLLRIRSYVYGGSNSSQVDSSDFSLVRGAIADFDEDMGTDGIQNALHTWIVANESNIKNKGGISATTYSTYLNIFNSLTGWKTAADGFVVNGWNAFGSRTYNDYVNANGTVGTSGNTGHYVIRNARTDDMVRYVAGNGSSSERYAYDVTTGKVETVISRLDAFLKAPSFIKLIGAYDPNNGVNNLSDFIRNLLEENLFTNDIINTVLALLYPMLTDLLENDLVGILRGMNGGMAPRDSSYSVGLNVDVLTADADLGDLELNGVIVDAALNGQHGTNSLQSIFTALHLYIYPSNFGSVLPSSVNGKSLSTLKTRLGQCGKDWNNMDATSRGGDGNGEFDKDDLKWVDWGVTNFESACNAMGAIFEPIIPLLRTVFCNDTFNGRATKILYVNIRTGSISYSILSTSVAGTNATANADLTINPLKGFNELWYPLMESFGITGYTSSLNVSPTSPMSSTVGGATGVSSANIVRCLLMPLMALIEKVANNPLDTVVSLLPNVAYMLTYDLIQPMLNALSLSMHLGADSEKYDIDGGTLASIVSIAEPLFRGAINDALSFDIPLDLGDKLDLADLLGADITNLNAILAKFVSGLAKDKDDTANMLNFPAINIAHLGRLGTKTEKTGSARSKNYDESSANLAAGHYWYIDADKADVLYDLIKFILDFAKSGGLMDILGALDVSLPDGIEGLLTEIQPENAIAALVELFLPRGSNGSGYSDGYDMANYNWYIPGTSTSTYNLTESSFVYLKYQNDWTAAKAKYIWDNADAVATAILEMIDPDKAESFNGISAFLLDFINGMFSNKGIMNVVDMFMDIASSTGSEDQTISALVRDQITINGQQANIDFRAWYEAFGYMYPEHRILGDGEFVYTNKNGNFNVGKWSESDLEKYGSAAGCATAAANGECSPKFVRAYPLAPTGFGGFGVPNGEESKLIPVAGNGQGKYGTVTSYYKYTAYTIPGTAENGYKATKAVKYVSTSNTIDASYPTNKFPGLRVSLGEADEDGNYWHWEVKGNQYTNDLGLVNNQWYALVDGAANARSVFTAIFCNLVEYLAVVFGLLFTSDDLNLFEGALTIKGYNCYDGAIIPVLEMLGVTGLKTQAQYTADYSMRNASSAADVNAKATGGFYYLVSKLFNSVGDLLSYDYATDGVTVIKTPVQKVIELLPGIFYFLQSNGLSTLIKNLLMPIWVIVDTIRPIADADLDDFIHQFLCNFLKLSYNKEDPAYASSPVVDLIVNLTDLFDYVSYNSAQAALDANYVNAIYSLTLDDLSLKTVRTVVEMITGLDLAPLTYALEGMCVGYTDITGVHHSVHNNAASAYRAVNTPKNTGTSQSWTLDYYGPDIITVTFSVVFDLLRYPGNANALDDLIGLTGGLIGTDALEGLNASSILEAIETIFLEKDDGGERAHANWDYLLEGRIVTRPSTGTQVAWVDGDYDLLAEFSDMSEYHSIYQLAYKTDWTYDTAYATNEMLSSILDYLTVSAFAKDNDEITTFAGFVDGLLEDNVFSGSVLKLLAGLMAQLYNLIPAELVGLIDALLDINMTAWISEPREYVKKGAERAESDILADITKTFTVDLNNNGEIDEGETFKSYQYKANGVVIDETYVPAVDAVITKTEMAYFNGEYQAKKEITATNEETQENTYGDVLPSKFYKIGAVETLEVEGAEGEEPTTVTKVKWAYVAIDATGATDTSEYVVNYDHPWWADEEATAYVDTRAEFIAAIKEMLIPAANLFSFIFLERDYELLYTAGDNLFETDDDDDAIILDGFGLYGLVVVPLFEALGIPLTLAQYNTLKAENPAAAAFYEDADNNYIGGANGFAPANYYDASAETNAEKYDGVLWINDMFDLFIALIDQILADPLNWVLDRLPALTYFINADGVTVMLENLFTEFIDVFDALSFALGERLELGNLAGLDLSDLSLTGILNLVYKFTGLYVREDLMEYIRTLYVGEIQSFWSANGHPAFTMKYTSEEDRADFITILLGLVIELVGDSGKFIDPANGYNYTFYNNPKAIDLLISGEDSGIDPTDPNSPTGIVSDILYALRNPAEIVYQDVNWNYFKEDFNLAENTPDGSNIVNTPGYAFQYLSYTTQWTYTKAAGTAAGFEQLIVSVLKLVDPAKFGDMTSLGELINVDNLLTGETLQSLLDMIAPFLFGESAVLNETILRVLGCVLGADLTQWNGNYAFTSEMPEGTALTMDAVVGLNYAVLPNYVLTSDTELDGTKTYFTYEDGEYTAVTSANAEEINTYYEYKNDVKTYNIANTSDFAKGLTLLLQPAYKLLGWLLFGDDYEFFTGNTEATQNDVLLTIQGSHGYANGLALLFEALGVSGIGRESAYLDGNGNANMALFVEHLVNGVINRVQEIIADPVNEIIALIPELIYFINANGLAVSLENFLAGPLALVNQLSSLVSDDSDDDEESETIDVSVYATVNKLVEDLLRDALGNDEITFSLDRVNLAWVMELAEAFTGMEITDVTRQSLDKFYMGKLSSYISANGKMAYKMSFDKSFIEGGNGDFADFITILLSYVIDIATYGTNAQALVALINGDKTPEDSGYIAPDMVQSIITLIREGWVVSTDSVDWFYFAPEYTPAGVTQNTETGKYEYTGTVLNPGDTITIPGRTIIYLTYASDWTEDTAEYLVNNRNQIIAAVLQLAGMGDGTVAAIIAQAFSLERDLYTGEILNKIFDLVAPIVSELPGVVLDLLNIVIDVDLSFYADENNRFDETVTYTRGEFVTGLTQMLSPLSVVLDWLLFGQSLQYFDKITTPVEQDGTSDQNLDIILELQGSEGYKYGLVPILEALGVQIPAVGDDDTTEDVLPVLLNNVLARVEVILANPVDEVLVMIPNLLYFINANGLAVSVKNLLAGVIGLLDEIAPLLGENAVDLDGLVNGLLADAGVNVEISIENLTLDLLTIIKLVEGFTTKSYYTATTDTAIVEGKTYYVLDGEDYVAVEAPALADIDTYFEEKSTAGLKIADVVTDAKIDNFFLGKLEYYQSANGKPAYRMVYSETEGMADMLTIIVNLVIEVLLYTNGDFSNAEQLDALINGVNSEGKPNANTVGGIVDILLGLRALDDIEPATIDWNYFDQDVELAEGVYVPSNAFVYLDYSNDWTYEKAAAIDTGIETIINSILALTAAEGEEPQTVTDLINGLVDLDELLSADLLNKLLDLVAPLLYGEDAFLNTALLNVIGLVLGADLTTWNYTYRFEAFNPGEVYGDHAETGLKYRVGDVTLGADPAEGIVGTTYENMNIFAVRNAEDFATGLAYVLAPASRVLGWLLLGQDYGFFVDNATGAQKLLVIPGFNGYDTGLVLLLEALGCKNVNEGGSLKAGADYVGNESLLLKDIITALLARVDEILADPIDEVLGLLPELIYFVNAGGLNALVQNIAGGLLKVVEYVNNSGLLSEPLDINLNGIISGFINEALPDGVTYNFALETVNLQAVIDIAELFTGLEISEAIGYSLATFALGECYSYNTVSSAYAGQTYKMRFATTGNGTDAARDRADMITILFSLVFDVLRYEGNNVALAALLTDVLDGRITAEVIAQVLEILNGYEVGTKQIDWLYPVTDPAVVGDIDENTTITMVERTINYLSYNSDWTEEKAAYVINNLDEIINAVLKVAGSEYNTLAELIAANFTLAQFYTADNLNAIVDALVGALGSIGETFANLIGIILVDDAIFTTYSAMEFDSEVIDGNRTAFANGLAQIIAPIGSLLDWLLFGKDIALFYDNDFYHDGVGAGDILKLSGANGYSTGLVPILEALGVEDLPEITAASRTNDVIGEAINAVLNRAEEILADPVDEVLALIPNLLYFINANGLSASVLNLLSGVLGLLDEVNPLLATLGIEINLGGTAVTQINVVGLLNSLLGGTLNGYTFVEENGILKLDLLEIVKIAEKLTGLTIANVVTVVNKIENFYLGQLEYFRSSNGSPAFRMVYTTEEDRADLVTIILNFVVEVALYEGNVDAILALINGDKTPADDGYVDPAMVNAIIALITGEESHYTYSEFKWNYADGTVELGSDVIVPKTQFIYLAYANDWTFNKAQLLDDMLVETVDTVIHMIKPEANSLSDLINGLVDLDALVFNANILNSLYNTIANLLYGEDAFADEVLVNAAGLLLDADLRGFNDMFAFEAKDDAQTYTEDDNFGLEYRLEGAKAIYAIDGKESFINGLMRILTPADRLLSWLFLGDDIELFVDNATGDVPLIKIGGEQGYAKGLALLLEALGVQGLEETYPNATEMLRSILTCLVARVEAILADPIDEVLALIPELIYFINANGLGVVVNNLAATAFNILDKAIELGLIEGVTDRDAWLNGLVEPLIENALGLTEAQQADFHFDYNKIDLQWVIDLVEVILQANGMDFTINGVLANSILGVTYPLSMLQIGKAVKYDSVSGFTTAYRADFADGISGANRADMLTILLTFVIDFIRNNRNAAAVEALAGLTPGTIPAILAVLTEFAVEINVPIDWFYFDEGYTYTAGDDLTTYVPTINYLTYASDWNEDLADYIDDNLDSIVATVLDLIPGMEGTTVAEILEGLFNVEDDLYTAEILNKIVTAVTNLLGELEGDLATLVPNAVDLLLDVDLTAYNTMTFTDAQITGKASFIDGLYTVLQPIFPVLDWMLFDEDVAFFNRATAANNIENILVINGYAGYAKGLVPLLEALGVVLPDVSNPLAEDYNTAGQLKGMLQAVLTRVEVILANPVEEALALIPNLLYFINANGLASAVNNLLGVVLQLVGPVNGVLDKLTAEDAPLAGGIDIGGGTMIDSIDVNYLLNHFLGETLGGYEIDVTNLTLIEVIKLAEALTGLDLDGCVRENGIQEFYLGQITYFTSANGKPAFKMVYSEDAAKDRSDLITVILNYLLDVVAFEGNAAALDTLLGTEGIVATVLDALNLLANEPIIGDFHWGYFNESSDAAAVPPMFGQEGYDEAVWNAYVTVPTVPFVNHLTYTSDWTHATADGLYDNLGAIVDGVLTIIAGDDASKPHSLTELINGSFTLYKAEYLNKIVELTEQLYGLLDTEVINTIGLVLGCDLSGWEGLNYTDADVYDADTFRAGLTELLLPISGVLDWLLFGDSFNFFLKDKSVEIDALTGEYVVDENNNIVYEPIISIAGAKGYIYGLAPILMALGVVLPEYHDGYKSKTIINEATRQTFLDAVLEAVLDRVDAILANPVDEVLDLLPELLYFINANGVSTAAYNLAGGVINAVNVLVDNNVINLEADSIEEYVSNLIHLDIQNLDLEGLFAFVETLDAVHELKINEVFKGTYTVSGGNVTFAHNATAETNIIEKFYIGEIEYYTYGGTYGYKMVNKSAEGRGDILTMLLSIVLDVVLYSENEAAFAAILGGFIDGFTVDNFRVLKALITTDADFALDLDDVDWVYFLGLTDAERQAAVANLLTTGAPNVVTDIQERTKHYLEYDNDWSLELADYLNENVNEIVDLVINMIDNNYLTLEDFINGKFNLYSAEYANKIVNGIAGLVGKLDDLLGNDAALREKLLTTAGSLLGVDINAVIEPITAGTVYNRATFINAVASRLEGLSTVLDWLLFGRDYNFFTKLENGENALLVINGGEGYKYGLAPILEAIGVDTHIEAEDVAHGALREILNNVADRVDELLYGANGCKTIDEVLGLLPELIYFINTGALSTCVMNLLRPADYLIATANGELGFGSNSVNDLIAAVDLENLSFDFIFDLLLDKTGINLDAPIGDYLKSFYFGALEYYTSYGNLGGFRMVYTANNNKIDMLTILVTLVLDVATYAGNEDAIVDLIAGATDDEAQARQIYTTVLALLTDSTAEVEYQTFDFILTQYADTNRAVSPMTSNGSLFTSIYGPLYTRAMGEYMTKYLQLLIDTYITLLGVQIDGINITSIEGLLHSLIGSSIYKREYIVSIYNALINLLDDLKNRTLGVELYRHVVEVLDSSLGINIADLENFTVPNFADGDREGFLNAISQMLSPIAPILRWLLTGDSIAILNKDDGIDGTAPGRGQGIEGNDYILIRGAEGYRYGIVPILEALNNGNTAGIMTQTQYETAAASDDAALIKNILNPIADVIDNFMAAPLDTVLNLLPAVVYFINSNGLDTCVKNLLGAVYALLNTIEPLIGEESNLRQSDGTIDLLALAGIDLRGITLYEDDTNPDFNLNSLLNLFGENGLVININGENFNLNSAVIDLARELSSGLVISYESQINAGEEYFQQMYSMKYAEGENVEGNRADFVTIILRLLLKLVSDHPDVIKGLLEDSLSGDGYIFLCSLIDNFAQMSGTQDGMDKIMYTIYFVFYGALVGGVAVKEKLDEFNGNYSFLNQLFATSDVAFLRQIEDTMSSWLTQWGEKPVDPSTGEPEEPNDVFDPDQGVAPNGFIAFFQRIAEFFKRIADFFKNLFN